MTALAWKRQILGQPEVATISSGGTPSRARPEFFGGVVRWVKSGDLNDGRILDTEERLSELGLMESSAKLFPPKTVLVAMYGATVGKTGLLEVEAATNQAVCAIRPNPSIFNPQFLQYLLMHLRPQLLSERYGGAQPNISQTIVRNLELPCPDVNEQGRIAAVLWKVQRALETEEKLIATARELKQSAMRQLFSHGLRNESQKETDIGTLPESWEIDQIGNRCEKPEYGVTASAKREPVGPQFLRITDITESGVDWAQVPFCECSKEQEQAKGIRKNDIMFARIGATTGKSYIVKDPPRAVFASYLIRVRPKAGLNADYLYYFFNSEAYWAQVNANKGNNLKGGVNGSILSSMRFPIPSSDEQGEIASILEAIDCKIRVHERKRAVLRELFATLLHKLMTGEIRVADLDIDVSGVALH